VPLILLFITVPLVELYLLIQMGSWLGLGATVALVVMTGAVGAALARREGFRVLAEWQDAMASGRMPREGVVGGLLVLVGGLLLITPGILTDLMGFGLMVPFIRTAVSGMLQAWMAAKVRSGEVQVVSSSPFGGQAGIPRARPIRHERGAEVIEIEGEVLEVDGRRVDPDPLGSS
jgi:UPF0716 protein FxsA